MVQQEHELKYLLTQEEYEQLLKLLEAFPSETALQKNYYYDTYHLDLRKRNITMRVREKDGCLQGTIKRHLKNHTSTEEHFPVGSLPQMLLYEGETVYLAGKLQTERTTYHLSDALLLMLDCNTYLDLCDYELELECPEHYLPQAKVLAAKLFQLLQMDPRDISKSKSERFFSKYQNQ